MTLRKAALLLAVLGLSIASSLAVMPATWSHGNEADFARGQFTGTAVTSRGEITMGRDVQVLMDSKDAPPAISDVAVAGDTIYAGSICKAEIFKIAGGKATAFAQVPGTLISCLLWTGKELLAGTGGDEAGIYRIDAEGKAKALWTDAKVKYVWAIVADAKGGFFAATGPAGQVFAIDAAGKAAVLYQAPVKLAKNILCLAAGKEGILYAGTDTKGLVIEIDVAAKTGRVILQAEEKEVSSIVPDTSGAVYAATSDASRAGGDEHMPLHGGPMGHSEMTHPTAPTTNPGMSTSAASKMSEDAADSEDESGDENPPADEGDESADEGSTPPGPMHGPMMHGGSTGHEAGGKGGPGNSVYCIGKDGLVNVIFHRPVTILAMVMHDKRLVLATGNAGTVYSVSLDGEDVTQLAHTEAKQVTALAAGPNGQLVFGTGNKGSVAKIGQEFAKEGTFVSKPLDAHQIAKWGTIRVSAKAPEGTTATIATRSGNVAEPDDKTWSAWSKEMPAADDFATIESPTARFLQYRVKFTSKGATSPALDRLSIVYQVGNLAPQLEALKVQAVAKDGGGMPSPRGRGPRMTDSEDAQEHAPKCIRMINLQASDPNNDSLVYSIFFRQAGAENWIKIVDKLRENQYAWDTRTVADGSYELKAVASDSPSNPPGSALEAVKTFQPVTVDNTPPTIKDLAGKLNAATATVEGTATDANRIVSIQYSVDSQTDWVSVLPKSGIADSNKEEFSFEVKSLKEGSHRIAVRVEDLYGNVGYSSVAVTVGK